MTRQFQGNEQQFPCPQTCPGVAHNGKHPMSDTTAGQKFEPVGAVFMMRVFYGFCVLAILSFLISLAGRTFGDSLALGGHSDDTTVHEIVLGNNVVSVPENMIRFERQRHSGVQSRLDLYAKWPEMTGYTNAHRDIFNYRSAEPQLLFLSFEEQVMSRDMSGRFDPIYAELIVRPGKNGPAGLSIYEFKKKAGYQGEKLATGRLTSGALFVARCSEPADLVATCERDVIIGRNLILAYRFPLSLLSQWRLLDASVMATARKMMRTSG